MNVMDAILTNNPLSKSNLEWLSQSLKKTYLPNVLEVYGFLSAIISGPNVMMPSEWLRSLGLYMHTFDSPENAERVVSLIMTIYSHIARKFSNQSFQVIYSYAHCQTQEEIRIAKKLWATGYMHGVALNKELWFTHHDASNLLMPIMTVRLSDHRLQTTKTAILKDDLSNAVNDIYRYWSNIRNANNTTRETKRVKFEMHNEPLTHNKHI